MLPIQPRRRRQRDEELAAIRIRPRVGHAEHARARVLERGADLVLECVAKDGRAAAAGACRVAALGHEAGDYAVEDGRGVVATADEGGEVLAGLGGVGRIELEGYGTLCVVSAGEMVQLRVGKGS